jgi:hypothetical protein
MVLSGISTISPSLSDTTNSHVFGSQPRTSRGHERRYSGSELSFSVTLESGSYSPFVQRWIEDIDQYRVAKICPTCRVRRALRSKHCREDDVCVAKFDHWCVWVFNSVGAGNHRAFMLMVVCVVIGSASLLVFCASGTHSLHCRKTSSYSHWKPIQLSLVTLRQSRGRFSACLSRTQKCSQHFYWDAFTSHGLHFCSKLNWSASS